MKNYTRHLLLIVAVIGVSWFLYHRTTPLYAMGKFEKAIIQNDKRIAEGYLTPTGDRVLTELLKSPTDHSRTEPIAILYERKNGNEFIIGFTQPSQKGPTTADFIMLKEGFHWNFHDIHVYTMDGYDFDVRVSYAIENPIRAGLKFAWENPGAMMGAFFEGLAQGIAASP